MYYNYDEYMKEILGYPVPNKNDRNLKEEDSYQTPITYEPEVYGRNQNDLTNCYPEIYKMLMPMVRKACGNLYDPVTEDDINRIALDIYFQFEADEMQNRTNETQENRSIEKIENSGTVNHGNGKRFDRNLEKSITSRPNKRPEISKDNREEEDSARQQRRPNNPLLFDLIRILILNQILGRPNRPGRPPFPPRPPRPPYPRDDYENYGDYPYWQY